MFISFSLVTLVLIDIIIIHFPLVFYLNIRTSFEENSLLYQLFSTAFQCPLMAFGRVSWFYIFGDQIFLSWDIKILGYQFVLFINSFSKWPIHSNLDYVWVILLLLPYGFFPRHELQQLMYLFDVIWWYFQCAMGIQIPIGPSNIDFISVLTTNNVNFGFFLLATSLSLKLVLMGILILLV